MLRKLELIEKLKEESDKANLAKTRFLSNMSHDIRTPMNAIVGYANLAKARKDDPAFLLECIDNILKSGKHLQGLINDVLDISRVESGKDKLFPEEYYRTHQLPEEPAHLEQSIRGKRALLVEDNQINSEIAKLTLEEFGVTVDCAYNGQEAVEMLESGADNTYDYILMDVQMPIMNGIEATKVIRASSRKYLQHIPIIAVTANAFSEDINVCLEAGMNAHIAKPFTPEGLRNTLLSLRP